MFLFFTILFGFLLRVSYIIKPEGLWNDEYVSWSIASTPFKEGFWHEILQQCHMPLYYLYLKLFGDSELLLRFSSVIPSILAIYVMYKVGSLHNKITAKTLAIITASTSFLIYYSQEVRFYSLLFLFSSLSLLFLLKYLKKNSKKNLIGYIITSLLILLTHTIGFVYIFVTSFYLIIKSKNKKLVTTTSILILILTFPLAFYIMNSVGTSQWWSFFTHRNIVFMFTDFFSPILTNNINVPSVIFYKNTPYFAFILLIPTILALISISIAIIKNKIAKELAFISLFTTTILILAALTGKFVFITKYNIEVLPILLYLFALGLTLSSKKVSITILSIWLAMQIGFIFSPDYVTKFPRTEGNRIPISILHLENLSKNDTIIFTYYNAERFNKYLNIQKYNIISLDKAKITEITTNYGKFAPKDYINNRSHISTYLKTIIKPKNRTFIVLLDTVAFFPDYILEEYTKKPANITIPAMYIENSVLKNEIIKYGKKNNLAVKFNTMGSWTVLVLEEDQR